jgi:hypothetical protein
MVGRVWKVSHVGVPVVHVVSQCIAHRMGEGEVKEKNAPVGTSECPIKNCAEVVPVFKYRDASGDTKKRRFAGRLYCVCPVHSRVENQEFLLENIKWQDEKKDASDAPPPVAKAPVQPVKPQASSPVKTPEKTVPAPVTPETPKAPDAWLPNFWK